MGAANVTDRSQPRRRSDAEPSDPAPPSTRDRPGSLRDLAGAYEAHARAVYSFAYYLCGRSGAEQLAQEAFLRWWSYVDDADGMTQRMSLLRSVYNCAVRAAGLSAGSQLAVQQASVGLAYFGGLTRDQVAAVLGEPSETVKVHIQRGMLRHRPARPATVTEIL